MSKYDMDPHVRELFLKVREISHDLCNDASFPCEHNHPDGISCLAVVGKIPTASFEEYDKVFDMCLPCKAYWLSLRLYHTVEEM